VFLKDFDLTYATLFNGVRHDSGDPIEWGEKMIAHYKKLGIDPKTKTLLFSDSLNLSKADALYRHFASRAKVAFGIGTDWTCPFPADGRTHPLNIVMKMVECNGSPVAKISNTPSKGMCRDEKYVEYLRRCIDWRMAH
jgi:nicotinate phosphoribosyltransferase